MEAAPSGALGPGALGHALAERFQPLFIHAPAGVRHRKRQPLRLPADGDPDLPVITDDGQAILVGNRCGVMEVTVASNPEWIIPENTITVTVEMPA